MVLALGRSETRLAWFAGARDCIHDQQADNPTNCSAAPRRAPAKAIKFWKDRSAAAVARNCGRYSALCILKGKKERDLEYVGASGWHHFAITVLTISALGLQGKAPGYATAVWHVFDDLYGGIDGADGPEIYGPEQTYLQTYLYGGAPAAGYASADRE